MSTPPPMTSMTVAPLLRISPPNRRLAVAKPIHPEIRPFPTTDVQTTRSNHNDTVCVYRATACTNPRAVKANGERHKFCQFHLRQTSLTQRKQSKTALFRDPSRVPAALLRHVPQTKLSSAVTTTSPLLLPRLRSHDVLRRALLLDAPALVVVPAFALNASSRSFVRSPVAHASTLRLPSIHTLVPMSPQRRDPCTSSSPPPASPSHLYASVTSSRLSVSSTCSSNTL